MDRERNISVIEDLDGRKIVMIHDIRFRGKRKINWKEVEQYLKQYIGEVYEIMDSADIVYVGNDFADEYSGSRDTARLKGALAKAKANGAYRAGDRTKESNCSDFRW
ncbi:hypothetical protein [Hungatella hathewayi]|uniref:hypothetical protein n=1 Tax=Hungatella hathewayi TaxID=154046 RepID=UPI0026DB4DE2|nr:hypothetical protein [Hungatella hathewayi]